MFKTRGMWGQGYITTATNDALSRLQQVVLLCDGSCHTQPLQRRYDQHERCNCQVCICLVISCQLGKKFNFKLKIKNTFRNCTNVYGFSMDVCPFAYFRNKALSLALRQLLPC